MGRRKGEGERGKGKGGEGKGEVGKGKRELVRGRDEEGRGRWEVGRGRREGRGTAMLERRLQQIELCIRVTCQNQLLHFYW